jgi:hypothetical protein
MSHAAMLATVDLQTQLHVIFVGLHVCIYRQVKFNISLSGFSLVTFMKPKERSNF